MHHEKDFKNRIRVQLKTGGPVMTISNIAINNGLKTITCIWVDYEGYVRTADFTASELAILEEKDENLGERQYLNHAC